MLAISVLFMSSCEEESVGSAASSCDVSCPPGTYYDEYRSERSVTTAYEDFQEGECRYSCVASAECPEGSWPVISAECYTCAFTLADGGSSSLSCDETMWWEDRDDEPDGQLEAYGRGGDVPVEPALVSEFRSATFIDGLSLDFEPNGLTYHGEHLWLGDWAAQSLKAIDLETGQLVDEVDVGGLNVTSLCSDPDKLWLGDGWTLWPFDPSTGDFLSGSLDGESCTWNGEFIVVPSDSTIEYYDKDTLQRDHHSYRTGFESDTSIQYAAWFADHLLQVRAEQLDVYSIHLFAWDLSEYTNHPLVGDFLFDWDVYPISGMTMVGNQMLLTGKLQGDYANKVSIFRID